MGDVGAVADDAREALEEPGPIVGPVCLGDLGDYARSEVADDMVVGAQEVHDRMADMVFLFLGKKVELGVWDVVFAGEGPSVEDIALEDRQGELLLAHNTRHEKKQEINLWHLAEKAVFVGVEGYCRQQKRKVYALGSTRSGAYGSPSSQRRRAVPRPACGRRGLRSACCQAAQSARAESPSSHTCLL